VINLPFKGSLIAKIAVLILSVIVLFVSGCGTLNVDIHTTIKPNGDIIQEIRYTADGLMGSAMGSSIDSLEMETDGWTITKENNDGTSAFVMTKTFRRGEDFSFTNSDISNTPAAQNAQFVVKNYFFIRKYHIEMTMLGSDMGEMPDMEEYGDLITPQMIDSMLHMTWSVTLPGKITATNADHTDGDTATWDFTYSSLQQDKYITVDSIYIAWPIIIAVLAGIIAVAAAIVVFVVLRKKKRAQPAVAEPPVIPDSM
jgi:protein-S-isoprenylcysteine O-methyltransferase Ste14